jgi:hypothetical protein
MLHRHSDSHLVIGRDAGTHDCGPAEHKAAGINIRENIIEIFAKSNCGINLS